MTNKAFIVITEMWRLRRADFTR